MGIFEKVVRVAKGDFSDKREIRTGYSKPIGMFEKIVQVIVYQLVFLKKYIELQKTTKSKAKNRAFSTWE